jgi:cbb3-type cytochrome oxidase subunit 3
MMDWLGNPEITKPIGLVIFFVTFCLIIYWIYGSRKRSDQLEQYKNIPFLDDEDEMKDKSNG